MKQKMQQKFFLFDIILLELVGVNPHYYEG